MTLAAGGESSSKTDEPRDLVFFSIVTGHCRLRAGLAS